MQLVSVQKTYCWLLLGVNDIQEESLSHFNEQRMGKLLLKVHPWLSLDTKYPQNAYLKIMRFNNRKRKIDHTEMVSYGAAKRPKETFTPQQVPESPSTSTALLDPESAPVILAPEEKVSIYHLWYMYVHGVDIYTFSYFR